MASPPITPTTPYSLSPTPLLSSPRAEFIPWTNVKSNDTWVLFASPVRFLLLGDRGHWQSRLSRTQRLHLGCSSTHLTCLWRHAKLGISISSISIRMSYGLRHPVFERLNPDLCLRRMVSDRVGVAGMISVRVVEFAIRIDVSFIVL